MKYDTDTTGLALKPYKDIRDGRRFNSRNVASGLYLKVENFKHNPAEQTINLQFQIRKFLTTTTGVNMNTAGYRLLA